MDSPLSKEVTRALNRAKDYARSLQNTELVPIHVFCSEIRYGKNEIINKFLAETLTDFLRLTDELQEFLKSFPQLEGSRQKPEYSADLLYIISKSWTAARKVMLPEVQITHFTVLLLEHLKNTLPEIITRENLLPDNWSFEISKLKMTHNLQLKNDEEETREGPALRMQPLSEPDAKKKKKKTDSRSGQSGPRILNLNKLEEFMHGHVMGQEEAIQRLSKTLRVCKMNLSLRPERPDGVFLFTGPTGVGKTEVARALSRFFFNDEKRMIRLDMSEFYDRHTITRLIGAPPAYIGYGDETYLLKNIRDTEDTILLLDEIEKAHLSILMFFLHIFEEGNMVDARGERVSFKNVTIIMTSNIRTEAESSFGFSNFEPASSPALRHDLARVLPPEFINRIDEIILFKPLSMAAVREIADIKLIRRTQSLLWDNGISLKFDEAVTDLIVEKGYSREFGARNMERAFQKLVLEPLAMRLCEPKMQNRKNLIAGRKGDEVVFGEG